MVQRRELLHRIFDRLHEAYGNLHWWPAGTPFEVIVGAILTQNTAWKNVEKCILALKDRGLLSFHVFCTLAVEDLAALIRPSGYYNQKARKLKNFCEHVQSHWQGDLEQFLALDMETLRRELLSLRGIGPETADSIVLYAARQPSFVVDTYTHRIFSRHDWIPEEWGYEELREFFMSALKPDVQLFNDYHALLVRTGHLHCRRRPACDGCPLHGWSAE